MTQGANDFQLTWKEIKKMDNMCCSGAGQTVSLLRRRCSDIRQSANQTLGVEHRDSLGSGGVLPPARIQSMKLCSHSVNIKENAVLILLCSSLWKILEHIPHAFLSNLPTDEKSSQYKDDTRYVYSSSENITLDATSFFVLSHQKVPFKSFGLGWSIGIIMKTEETTRLPTAAYLTHIVCCCIVVLWEFSIVLSSI